MSPPSVSGLSMPCRPECGKSGQVEPVLQPHRLTLVEQTGAHHPFFPRECTTGFRATLLLAQSAVTPFPWPDLAIIVALVVLNGVFAMSELAIVSAKTSFARGAGRGGIDQRPHCPHAGRPIRANSFPTVQIGITLIGIIAGAYSGASLGKPVGEAAGMARPAAAICRRNGFCCGDCLHHLSQPDRGRAVCPSSWRCARRCRCRW